MACAKSLVALGLVIVASLGSAQVATTTSPRYKGQVGSERGCDLLFKALEKSRKICVEAIVVRDNGPRQQMQLKIEQAYGGAARFSILSPLSQQGIVSYDDGKEWQTYLPDENRLLIQPSPRLRQGDSSFREKLACQNYNFNVAEGKPIAGRAAYEVTAKPKFEGMPKRVFFIDIRTLYLLRTDVDEKTTMETRSVSYPQRMRADDLVIKPLREVREVRMNGPKSMPAKEVQRTLGFQLSLPKNVPLGFAVVDTQLVGHDYKVAAIRMTDGLATLTVYQSDADRDDDKRRSTGASGVARGVRMQAMGDLPLEMLKRILEAFLKGLQAQAGSDYDPEALNSAFESGATIIFVTE